MISPNSPSDPTTRCVGSASASASAGASNNPPGPSESSASVRSPTPTGTDALSEPATKHQRGASATASNTRTCRVCGCTEITPCTGPNDYACWWVEPDLCSSCQPMDGVER